MNRVDPFDLLRELNPALPDELPDAASPEGEALYQAISERRGEAGRPRLLPRIGRRAGRRDLIPAIAILVLSVGAVAWALSRSVTEPLTVGCYGAADLRAKTAVVPAEGQSPLTACRRVWDSGEFGDRTTPPLHACVLPTGSIGVFPQRGRDTCGSLALPPAPIGRERQPAPAVELKERLVDRFLSESCITPARGREIVAAELHRLRLSDWRVEDVAPFTDARPCATLAFDPPRNVVLLVPSPPGQ